MIWILDRINKMMHILVSQRMKNNLTKNNLEIKLRSVKMLNMSKILKNYVLIVINQNVRFFVRVFVEDLFIELVLIAWSTMIRKLLLMMIWMKSK